MEVIIFDPELEIWVWTESQHIAAVLGWDNYLQLKEWLREQGLWQRDAYKPSRPKEALEISLKRRRIPRSSSIYLDIAKRVNLNLCQEASFIRFKNILQQWFSLVLIILQ